MDRLIEETDGSASNSSLSGTKTPKNYFDSPYIATKALREKTTIYEISESDMPIFDDAPSTESKESMPGGHQIRGKKLYFALAGLDALLFIAALDLTIIATVYVEIANNFNALSRAEWTVTSYMLAATAIQPLYGKFSDILGRAEAIVVSVLLFAAGSIMCA
ncbi:hypothetical protein LPJ56_007073, partial [Coemansia sp. RSA 2599]